MKTTLIILLSLFSLSTAFAQQSTLLENYRKMALDYNHSLKAAEKNIKASMELEKSARANRKPQLSGNASFKYTGNPTELSLNLPALGHPVTFKGNNESYGLSASLMQPVYTGGQVLENIRLAQHRHSLAMNESAVVRSAVCYQTDIQYWNTIARNEIKGVATDFYKSVFALVKNIQERVEAGLIDPQELLMAEVKLNEAKFQVLQAESDFETGRMALNSLLGLELQNPTELDTLIPIPAMQDSLLLLTGMDRPEIRMARDQISIAESALKIRDANYKPQLYVGVDGSYSSPGYNFRQDMDPNYAAYAKLSIPVFEWGKRRSEKRASTEQVGMATDQLNQVADEVSLEVQTAKVALLQALERVALSSNSLGKARENEEKALERYYEGKISLVEVIDAQTYRQTAQLNDVQARTAAQYHYSDMVKALDAY